MFQGYKLKFEFNAAHSNVENNIDHVHFHTFTIVLYLHDLDERMDYFYDIEKNVNEWLAPYRDCYLHETELFRNKSTTLESIGDTFYDLWVDRLRELQFDLVRLDIFENPIRVYSVSDRILDADVNEIGALPYAFYDSLLPEGGTGVGKQAVQQSQEAAGQQPEESPEESQEAAGQQPGELQEADQEAAGQQPEESQEAAEQQPEKDAVESDTGSNIAKTATTKPATARLYTAKPETASPRSRKWFVLCYAMAIGVLGYLIMYLLRNWGTYPAGSDTYCHLYRADVLLQQIKDGNFFPLYDPYWYNGVEIMRYWGPVPLYILAFLEYIGGTIFEGYLGYVGFIFVLGALGWLWTGCRINRVHMGMFVGVIWFFLPENMKVLFYDGNLPRALINALLPYMICLILELYRERKEGTVLRLTLLFTTFSLCHIGTTLMLLAVLILYLLFYGKLHKSMKVTGQVLFCAVIGMLLSGVWLVASLHGSGAGGSGSNQIMEGFFQSAFTSLNPIPAWQGQTLFYFGLSLFLLCLIGIFLGNKETAPGFAVGLIIFFATTNSAYDILSKLPFSSYLWMMRFVSMALAFVMASLLLWKGLKRYVVLLLCLLVFLDCVPTVRYLYSGVQNEVSVEEKNEVYADSLLLNQGKEITCQRMAVFDLSGYGAFVPYYVAGVDRKVPYMFGAGWEGARTAENIVMLNTAVETGRYDYVFDRCLEMGTDTAVFVVNNLSGRELDIGKLKETGEKYGYELIAENSSQLLFHKDMPETFGVITDYPYLAIGDAADDIALLYPAFEEGRSDNLSDYDYEELKQYDILYLSDFVYDDKEQAEEMLTKLAEQGTKIYIDMNKAPVNAESNIQEMFGVSVQSMTYNGSFPVIQYEGNEYKTSAFPDEYKQWKANYLIGLQNVTGYGDINGKELAFCGTNGNENIIFLGYNFIYYTELTDDSTAKSLLYDMMRIEEGTAPERQPVPIRVEYGSREIRIESDYDGVNTTLADIPDIFTSAQEYENAHHMITVDQGTTEIQIHYPYLLQGVAVTILGFILLTGFLIYVKKGYGNRDTMTKE